MSTLFRANSIRRAICTKHTSRLDKAFDLTEPELETHISALNNQIGGLNNHRDELIVEKNRVAQLLQDKNTTSARLKSELAEARPGMEEAVLCITMTETR